MIKRNQWIGIAAGVMLACGATGQAIAAQPSEQQVRQLFEVMHMSQMFGQMNAQMAGVMGRAVPCVPAAYWQNFIDASGAQQLLGRMVPVYQSHFTAEDVSGLLKFYQSPLGQKVITQLPLTMAEGMKVGQQWGRERGQAMVRQLEQKGTLDANGRCPASPAATAPAPLTKPAH
ncbi:DUF2059 domain-containing protein [Rhodanobacter sp. C03]|uniref:DUF2059 domain-containing protein n=1 Tax=Rhodanobacter sp. C03 TaxID=1945858 RepID=UPI0009874D5D|nr:DUF2059 domain-containing protein [Rhodanobacter sp. C03]OOG60133.1 hypothetical protein B0E48_05090 [Rhodanobacter sp. C03]